MIADFHKDFRKELEKMPKKYQEHFYKKLDIFFENPFHPILNNHQRSGKLENTRSINITGDIRAIYKQTGDERVLFLTIASHSKLYD